MKKIISKLLPNYQSMKHYLGSSRYADKILNSNCLHITHRSVSRAVGIGLFFAFLPIPLQMILAATTAILFRANIMIAIIMTWITNPITFLPFNYLIFSVGHYVTQNDEVFHSIPTISFNALYSSTIINVYGEWLKQAGISFLVGIPIVATLSAIFGYILVEILWRAHVYLNIMKRKRKM